MEQKAWIVAVDMGYGHQRAAYPLRNLSPDRKVLIANNYAGIPKSDFRLWNSSRRVYEFFSRLNNVPLIGRQIFSFIDLFQRINPYYPRHDMSRPNFQLKDMYAVIRRGWGKHLVDFLNTKNIPLITTFFTVAFMAEEHKFKNEIYVVICDSDIARSWVSIDPAKSRIKFLAPCRRVVDRLKEYGVKAENIFLTGFPLPEETLGSHLRIVKSDLAERIINLDPERRYHDKYGETIKQFLGTRVKLASADHHPLTLTFAVGGAGVQRKIADSILHSLRKKILHKEINVNLIAGTRNDVYCYFEKSIIKNGLQKTFNQNLKILFALDKEEYFRELSAVLRASDILWTKPSELVFYSALGLPIITAPSVGSQEDYNHTWLKTIGAGITQNDPRYTDEWLFDWIKSGWLAQAAMSGFLDGRQFGVHNIIDVVFNGVTEPTRSNSLL